MKNKMIIVSTLAITVCVILCTMFIIKSMTNGTKDNNDVTIEQNNDDVLTIDATIWNAINTEEHNDCVYRIENMEVLQAGYSIEDEYFALLEDTEGYLWEVVDVDLYPLDNVLVLMCDNDTSDDITDDEIIHCWVGIE